MYEAGSLIVTSPETTVKVANVRRDPRVALLIDDGESYVMIRGTARISERRDPVSDIERLAIRYEGVEGAKKSLPELLKERQVSIEVVPVRVASQNV